ncbi:MAG TPA: hypothetical protein VMC03_07540 [Streptosporangiaceae bacterium]|nr:hypothetical protein [Streptosporangiaceae bacterium]
MSGSGETARPPIDLQGLAPDVALLTAIDQALDVAEDELRGRVALVRRYLRYLLDGLPDTRRNDRFRVIAGMIARDVSEP